MSVNKTIKALREERSMLYAEIRRLQAAAGESPSNADMVRDLRLGVDVFETPKHVIADMERAAQALTGFQVPTHMLFGHESEESMRAHLAELGVDTERPKVVALVKVAAVPADVRGGGKCQDVPYFDWREAPEGTTHAMQVMPMPVLWLKLIAGETAEYWSTAWGGQPAHWHATGDQSSLYLDSADVVARPTPEEVWSVTGKDGSWSYPSLAALLRDNYGSPEDGTSFAPFLGNGLKVGDTVQRAIVCKNDPAGFVPDTDEVIQYMSERAQESDAGEWADDYPHVGDESMAELEKALEPLASWARKHCQPDFFTVKDITPHTITEADVRAAQ